jgi:hypothetical protein
MDRAAEAVNHVNEVVVQFVREQPVVSLCVAMGLGFAIAKIADRF